VAGKLLGIDQLIWNICLALLLVAGISGTTAYQPTSWRLTWWRSAQAAMLGYTLQHRVV
jgi:hypothetical protein